MPIRSPEAKERRRLRDTIKRHDKARLKAELGICFNCDQPIVPGRTLCRHHLDIANQNSHRRRQDPKVVEHIWHYNRNKGRFKGISGLARRQGKTWELSEEAWRQIISMPCRYCEFPSEASTGAGMDRLDNSKGYVEGNVVSCCHECNSARSDNFTPEEMINEIGPAIRRVKLARLARQKEKNCINEDACIIQNVALEHESAIVDGQQTGQNSRRNKMATGRVKWFSSVKGYGFVTPDAGGKDLFVHHSEIQAEGYRELKEGQLVEYEEVQDTKGPKATKVVVKG